MVVASHHRGTTRVQRRTHAGQWARRESRLHRGLCPRREKLFSISPANVVVVYLGVIQIRRGFEGDFRHAGQATAHVGPRICGCSATLVSRKIERRCWSRVAKQGIASNRFDSSMCSRGTSRMGPSMTTDFLELQLNRCGNATVHISAVSLQVMLCPSSSGARPLTGCTWRHQLELKQLSNV